MADEQLFPPIIRTVRGAQGSPTHLQVSVLVRGEVLTFQQPVDMAEWDDAAIGDAAAKLKAEILKVAAESV